MKTHTDTRWAAVERNKDPVYMKMKDCKNCCCSHSLSNLRRGVISLKICLRSVWNSSVTEFSWGFPLWSTLLGWYKWEEICALWLYLGQKGDDGVFCSWEHQGEPHSVFLLSFSDLLYCGKWGLWLGCISPCYMLWEEGKKEGFVS